MLLCVCYYTSRFNVALIESLRLAKIFQQCTAVYRFSQSSLKAIADICNGEISCTMSQRTLRRQRKTICKTKRHTAIKHQENVSILNNIFRVRADSAKFIVLRCTLLPCANGHQCMSEQTEDKVTVSKNTPNLRLEVCSLNRY